MNNVNTDQISGVFNCNIIVFIIVIILGAFTINPFTLALAIPDQLQNTSSIPNLALAPNKQLIAIVGPDQTVNSGDVVTLDGNGSRNPDGKVVSYSWIQFSGPAIVLIGANALTSSFTAPTVTCNTELKFSLTVTDNKGSISNPSIVTVNVKPVVQELVQSRTSAAATNGTNSTHTIINDLEKESGTVPSFVSLTKKTISGNTTSLTRIPNYENQPQL
ncbi:MAG: hypothetical protein WB511_07650 [Nitrososphaeraceae archaeon]